MESTKSKPNQPTAAEAKEAPGALDVNAVPRSVFERLRSEANSGKVAAQKALGELLDAHPEAWREIGDIGLQTERLLLQSIAAGDWFTAEAFRRCAAELRIDLQGKDTSPLERLAAQNVVGAWLRLQYATVRLNGAENDLRERAFWQRQQDLAQRHVHAALKSLIMSKALPTIQEPATAVSPQIAEPGHNKSRRPLGDDGVVAAPRGAALRHTIDNSAVKKRAVQRARHAVPASGGRMEDTGCADRSRSATGKTNGCHGVNRFAKTFPPMDVFEDAPRTGLPFGWPAATADELAAYPSGCEAEVVCAVEPECPSKSDRTGSIRDS